MKEYLITETAEYVSRFEADSVEDALEFVKQIPIKDKEVSWLATQVEIVIATGESNEVIATEVIELKDFAVSPI